jgi:hypothetical protein
MAVETVATASWVAQLTGEHAKHVARRYGGATVKAPQLIHTTIQTVLSDPAKLRVFVDKMSNWEREALRFVRENGGTINGYLLQAHLIGLGMPAPAITQMSVWGQQPSNERGTAFIWWFFREGLLLPLTGKNAWSDYSRYYHLNPSAYFITAPPQLLVALGQLAPMPAPTLPVAVQRVALVQRSPWVLFLEAIEAYRALVDEGGLALTQSDTPNKTAIKRMIKKRPFLEQNLSNWLEAWAMAGVINFSREKSVVEVVAGAFSAFMARPIANQAQLIAQKYLSSDIDLSFDSSERGTLMMRMVLAQALRALPGPAELEEALLAMHQKMLRFVASRDEYDRASGKTASHLHRWFRDALTSNGLFAQMGLAAFGETEINGQKCKVVAAGPLLRPLPALQPGQALIVQPNFEVLIYLERLSADVLPLLLSMEAQRFDAQTASYRLTRQSIYAFLEQGYSLEGLLTGLRQHSATPLSGAMEASLRDWAAKRERLIITAEANVLEFDDGPARDKGQKTYGGTQLGERYLLVGAGAAGLLPKKANIINYQGKPSQTVQFAPDGRFMLLGGGDLLSRTLLEQVSVAEGEYRRFVPERVRAAGKTLLDVLQPRSVGGIPSEVRLLLSIWSSLVAAPGLGDVTLFQHPEAARLAALPQLAGFFEGAFAPNLLLVRPKKRKDLEAALKNLAIDTRDLSVGGAVVAAGASISAPSAQQAIDTLKASLQHNLPTRQVRTVMENAIVNGEQLYVLYNAERQDSRTWFGRSVRGERQIFEHLKPSEVFYNGSIPYLRAKVVETDQDREVRIGYVLAIGVAV